MVLIDCAVRVREDGTIEATPQPETLRVVAKRRIAPAPAPVRESAS